MDIRYQGFLSGFLVSVITRKDLMQSSRPSLFLVAMFYAMCTHATTFTVNNEADLRQAIIQANAQPGINFIDFRANISLSQDLPPIISTVTIRGNGFLLDGENSYQLFTIGQNGDERIFVQLSHLTLQNAFSQASTLSTGAGDVAWGAALKINSDADVAVSDVNFLNNKVQGGNGNTSVGIPAIGASGGYGQGGGVGSISGGVAGVGGGDGNAVIGGGGAGLGGAVFVAKGANLSISGSSVMKGNQVSAGYGAENAQAVGEALFLQGSGNLQLHVNSGETIHLANSFSDAVGSGLVDSNSKQKWNVWINGGGGVPIDTSNLQLGLTYGEVFLEGQNQVAGNLYISAADVHVKNNQNLGGLGQGLVVINDGGLYLSNGQVLTQEIAIDQDGARIGVDSGAAILANALNGSGDVHKVGNGSLELQAASNFTGKWLIEKGEVVIDGDNRLGNSNVVLNGGALKINADINDLRPLSLGNSGGALDNNGYNLTLNSVISQWTVNKTLVFKGEGVTQLLGFIASEDKGNTKITEGLVQGNIAHGILEVTGSGEYQLTNNDALISALKGNGKVSLGNHSLLIDINDFDAKFYGELAGSGSLILSNTNLASDVSLKEGIGRFYEQKMLGVNSYSGGTFVNHGSILTVNNDASLGTGAVTLSGGVLQNLGGVSNTSIMINGSGAIYGKLDFSGEISGTGDLYKLGTGTLILNNTNNYSGNTYVSGLGSKLAIYDSSALGTGDLHLSHGGMLSILGNNQHISSVKIGEKGGFLDTNQFNVYIDKDVSGVTSSANFIKKGSGILQVNGAMSLGLGIAIEGGSLQIGDGGNAENINADISIVSGSNLITNHSNTIYINGNISGYGRVIKDGSGTLVLNPKDANTFLGGLVIREGLVGAANNYAFGLGSIVVLDGGGVWLLNDRSTPNVSTSLNTPKGGVYSVPNLNQDINLASGGGTLSVTDNSTFVFGGNVTGSGTLKKTGNGTLIYTGYAGQAGNTVVESGLLQIGNGLQGSVAGDIQVNKDATLVFARDDVVQYSGTLSGLGNVIKKGLGELILTGDELLSGNISLNQGNLRIGLGTNKGSLQANADLSDNTKIIFDRNDLSIYAGNTQGLGVFQKVGSGDLIVTGSLSHQGGTYIDSGSLIMGTNQTTGLIEGNVILSKGTALVLNRKDDVALSTTLQGEGSLVKSGEGKVDYRGQNNSTGGVFVQQGVLSIDADSRLGKGNLILMGGDLQMTQAISELRDIQVSQNGGGLDIQNFNITYTNNINGTGAFVKKGMGTLTLENFPNVPEVAIAQGSLQLNDSSSTQVMVAKVNVQEQGELVITNQQQLYMSQGLSGLGIVNKNGNGELYLQGDSKSFSGDIHVNEGVLRFNSTVGGNLLLAENTEWGGNGIVLGSVNANSAIIAPGNSIGKMQINQSLTMDKDSSLEIELDQDGNHDQISVLGNAVISGKLKIIPKAGEYIAAGCCRYDILTASEIIGEFSSIQNDLAFLSSTIDYTPQSVSLAFGRNNVAFSSVSYTDNQKSVSAALDNLEVKAEGDDLRAVIAPVSAEKARDMFDVLSGDVLMIGQVQTQHAINLFQSILNNRASRLGLSSRGKNKRSLTDDLFNITNGNNLNLFESNDSQNSHAYAGPTSKIEGIWVESSLMKESLDSDELVGSPESSFKGQMHMLGFDGYWSDKWIVGVAAGLESGDFSFSNRKASSNIDGKLFGLYARYDNKSGWQYKFSLAYAQATMSTQRTLSLGNDNFIARSAQEISSWGFSSEAGFGLHLGNYGLRPFAFLNAQSVAVKTFSEQEASYANLAIQNNNRVVGELGLGTEVSRPFLTAGGNWAQIQGSVAVVQAVGQTQAEQTAVFSQTQENFTTKLTKESGTRLQMNLGTEWYMNSVLAVFAGYQGRISSTTQEHSGVVSLQYRW